MTKTLNQIIFFSSTKIRLFFQQHWESEYFFLEKNHNTPWKLNGPSPIHMALHNFIAENVWNSVY